MKLQNLYDSIESRLKPVATGQRSSKLIQRSCISGNSGVICCWQITLISMKQLYRKFLLVMCFCIPAGAAFAAGHVINLVSTTNVLCNGGNTGSATVSVSGGVGPFTYSWVPTGGTAPTANNLVAGTYTVVATDQNDGSTATRTVLITQPPALNISITTTMATCGFPNGSAQATVAGGVPPYSAR